MDDDAEAEAGGGLPEPLVATLADPAGNGTRVPYLLGLLDGEDPDVRLAAGTALCLVAATDRRLRAVVVERLLDRVEGDVTAEVPHTLDYLAARHPEAVESAVSDLDADARRRVTDRLARAGSDGDGPVGTVGPDWAVVRTGDGDPTETGAETSTGESDPASVHVQNERSGVRADRRVTGGQSTSHRAGVADTESDDGSESTADAADEDRPGVTARTLRTVSRQLSTVVAASRFDDLTVLSEGRRDRYGDVYRAAGRLDGRDYAVALVVYRERGAHASFVDAFGPVMEAWHEVSDHRAVLPVYDWSPRPRPWAAVEYAGGSLATQDDPVDPLWTALELAGAVRYAHGRGVAHGAIDPGNVAYRDVELDRSDRQPLLTNVGVTSLPSETDDGTTTGDETGPDGPVPRGVDPRYAAPEHYDDDYGRVDATTDVYCLGTLLFRLVTGEHPYTGDSGTVRERVLSDGDHPSSDPDPDLPAALERVVRKATANRKIKRYETVTAFERELRQVHEQTTTGESHDRTTTGEDDG